MLEPVTMTFDKYDAIESRFEEIKFRCEDWVPSISDLMYYSDHCSNSAVYVEFLMWILNTYDGEETEEWLRVKKYAISCTFRFRRVMTVF